MKIEKNSLSIRGFIQGSLKFTQRVIVWVALLYIANWIASVIMIAWAIATTNNFSYLDTLITETSITFRDIVGVAIIKFCVENVFKYNDFGGKVCSLPYDDAVVEETTIIEDGDTNG